MERRPPMRRNAPSGGRDSGPRMGGDREGGPRMGGRPGGRFRPMMKKTCRFCADKNTLLDYKDSERLRKFLTEKGKIIPSRITGNCATHQRMLARVIKRARHGAVIAFQSE